MAKSLQIQHFGPHEASFKFYVPVAAMINTTNVVFPNAINHPQQQQEMGARKKKLMYNRWYNHNPKLLDLYGNRWYN